MRWVFSLTIGTAFVSGGLLAVLAPNLPAKASTAERPKVAPAKPCADADGYGYGPGCLAGQDCNDSDSRIHPGRPEECNFRNDDCNALVDDQAGCAEPPIDRSAVTLEAGPFLMGSAHAALDMPALSKVDAEREARRTQKW